jgi:hypothetical protein
MRVRDVLGFILALFIAAVLMVREFTQWEGTYLSFIKIGLVILGAFLVLVGCRTTNRPSALMGFIVTVFTAPFIFRLEDLTNTGELLLFALLVGLPAVLLLECVTSLKAGKQDISFFTALTKKDMRLQPYHYVPIIWCLGIVMILVVLLVVLLNLPMTTRVIPGGGFQIWQILVFIGVSLLLTVPFIGPFTVRVKKSD